MKVLPHFDLNTPCQTNVAGPANSVVSPAPAGPVPTTLQELILTTPTADHYHGLMQTDLQRCRPLSSRFRGRCFAKGTLALLLSSAATIGSLALGTASAQARVGGSSHDPPRSHNRWSFHRGKNTSKQGSPEFDARTSVIGGAIAEPGTFPWMAFVLNQAVGFSCSGTVISPNIVLTAGHCAVNLETGVVNRAAGYRVVTGALNWAQPERQVSRVSRVLVYPHFKIAGSLSGWGDAALLVLSTPTKAPAITLATAADSQSLRLGTPAMIAGWGNTYYNQFEPTEQLMWANTVVEGRRCDRLPDFRFKAGICTVDPPSYAAGACNGDSGGPLLAAGAVGQGQIEIGITHGGYGHCLTRAPDLFTRADLISTWANRWIAALAPS